jgi:hypothetical protein
LLLWARDELLGAMQAHQPLGAEAWALVVHCLLALGQQAAAVNIASELLNTWPENLHLSGPFMPPQRADLARPRSTSAASFLHQRLAEFVALRSAHSTYFKPAEPARWAALWCHPDHSAAVERAGLLVHLAARQAAPLERLRHVPSARHGGPRHAHAAFWARLLEELQDDRTGPAPHAHGLAAAAQPNSHNALVSTLHGAV